MANTNKENDRFQLVRMDRHRWIVTDRETGYSIAFKEGEFNTSQRVIVPEDTTQDPHEAAQLAAYSMRSIGDYMAVNHRDLVFTTAEREAQRQRFYDIMGDIGQSIADLRKHQGITIEQASKILGYKIGRVEAIEAGKMPTNITTLTRVVENLGGRLAIIVAEDEQDPHCQFIEFEED